MEDDKAFILTKMQALSVLTLLQADSDYRYGIMLLGLAIYLHRCPSFSEVRDNVQAYFENCFRRKRRPYRTHSTLSPDLLSLNFTNPTHFIDDSPWCSPGASSLMSNP